MNKDEHLGNVPSATAILHFTFRGMGGCLGKTNAPSPTDRYPQGVLDALKEVNPSDSTLPIQSTQSYCALILFVTMFNTTLGPIIPFSVKNQRQISHTTINSLSPCLSRTIPQLHSINILNKTNPKKPLRSQLPILPKPLKR